CVVCHACYDAPCQLVLSAFEGAERGASQEPVYDSTRLVTAPPTRLFVDARDTGQWREMGFFGVLPQSDERTSASLLLSMPALGPAHGCAEGEPLPDDVSLDIDRHLECPTQPEFDRYASEHPHGGMPYGMAPLSGEELRVLAAFASQPTAAPAPRELAPAVRAGVARRGALPHGRPPEARTAPPYLYPPRAPAHLAS